MTDWKTGKPRPQRSAPHTKISLPLRHGRLLFKISKYSIFSLLLIDMIAFFITGSLNETLDSLGWLILLGTFEYESITLNQDYAGPWEKWGLMAVQTLGYGIAIKTTITYGLDGEWLDLLNAALWLLVCCTLAYDIYVPGDFGGREWRIRNALKMLLYMGLVACAATWAVERDWLDFVDAVLWLLCFGLVELNIFEFEEGGMVPSFTA